MKTIFTAVLFLFISVNGQEKFYTFSELKGMEDLSGSTHLFYRLYNEWEEELSSGTSNSIYHLDLNSNIDTLFLSDFGEYFQFFGPRFQRTSDLVFWNSNPSEYIFCGSQGSDDGFGFIQRFDMESGIYLPSFNVYNIEISSQNDSLLYAGGFSWFKTIDGGRNWEEYLTNNIQFISLSPFNDEIMFASDDSSLYKSTNSGMNFSKVDTSDYSEAKFYYDKDSNHIYSVSSNMLRVSGNRGDAFSWAVQYSGSSTIHASLNYSQSGSIYLSDGRYIYHSEDYGITFNEYKVLDRKIVGLYNKPGTDKLYAATKYDLYEISADTIITLKHLVVDPDIFSWYPLQVGNKWVYEVTVEIYKSAYIVEVIDDTLIDEKHYFRIKYADSENVSYSFERVDSSSGKIYRHNSDSGTVLYDLSVTEVGDTAYFDRSNENEYGWVLEYQESFNQWGINSTKNVFNILMSTSGYRLQTFVKSIGLFKDEGGEVLYSSKQLKGFIKNGVVYGDTTLVGIDDNVENLPVEFSLLQNYPNPFNPSTKIQYAVGSRQNVSLKIYDVLGSEIITLVNEEKPAGEYEIEFNGSRLSSGIYFYQLKAGNSILTKKMVYLK